MKWRGVTAGGLAAGLAAVGIGLGGLGRAEGGELPTRVWHVMASADSGGDGSATEPFRTIEEGIAAAQAGQIVLVHNGTYRTKVKTVRGGRAGSPIRIVGGGATVVGDDSGGRTIQILHNYVTLEGMRVTKGDSLVWVQGATGVRLLNNVLYGAGGECVRLKYFSSENEIARNRITDCGKHNFSVANHKKNGEGVYIGTAPEQLYRNPDQRPDRSNGNWVHDNVISSRAECVDVKESASRNVVARNTCTDGQDPDGAGFSSRGKETMFVGNIVFRHAGAGIRLGGDGSADGTGSYVERNQLRSTLGYGVKVQRLPQAQICGNVLLDNSQGKTNGDVDPTAPC